MSFPVQSNVSAAAHVLGLTYEERLFYLAAIRAGFPARFAEDRAREAYPKWASTHDPSVVPWWVNDFCSEVFSDRFTSKDVH